MDENSVVLAKTMLNDPIAKLCEGAWLRSAEMSTNQLLTIETREKPAEIRTAQFIWDLMNEMKQNKVVFSY